MMLDVQRLITQHQQRQYLRQQGFTSKQAARIVNYRALYQMGLYQGESGVSRRLLFARWLYLHGKIGK